jgi:serine/threonine protein kinase
MERYVDKKTLGDKGFGKTYLALDEVTGKHCVKKVIDTSIIKSSEYDTRTISQIKDKLSHENLVRLISAEEDVKEQQYAIVSEYIEGKFETNSR